MKLTAFTQKSRRAFTLTELLIVVGIIAFLSSATIMSLSQIQRGSTLNSAIHHVTGLVNLARAHATAQNTYVYLFLDHESSSDGLQAFVWASRDGDDPLKAVSAEDLSSATFTIEALRPPHALSQVRLSIDDSALGQDKSVSWQGQTYTAFLRFHPDGQISAERGNFAAQHSIVLQPVQGATTGNTASIRVASLTGNVEVSFD